MASGASSLESTGSNGGTLQQMFNTSKDRSITSNSLTMNDCEILKQQHDKVVEELNTVRRQQTEANRRCDHAMKELEYYRGQHRAVMSQLEGASQEMVNLKTKYNNLASEKQRSERQVQQLQEEISSLHSDTLIYESTNGDTSSVPLRKYDSIKNQYESLRKRYDDLMEIHKSVENKMEQAVDDNTMLKKQFEDLSQEKLAAVRERNNVKQQYTAAIRELDMAIRQRNEYKEALSKITGQYEEAIKEINQAMAVRMKASKDLKRLTEERNAALQEYTLIMSERDNVHKEMEKLSDDLSQSSKKTKALEAQCQEIADQKQTLIYQMETLRREITAALNDRDKALKECNELQEKFGEYKEENRSSMKNRLEFSQHSNDSANRDVSTKDSDTFHRAQRERENNENLENTNPEIERLRKSIEKLQSELNEATQEAEVSKRRRDWAFSERDKIVLERESIRTLCDRLRKERDRAVSDLAEALRDSDDIKKQRNEASKELKELKEKVEAHIEKEARTTNFHPMHNSGNNRSQDSAIDADIQEWECEVLDLDFSNSEPGDIGFDIVGGRSDPRFPNDCAIFVTNIIEGSPADGKLKLYDCIARVNNMDCSNASRRSVLEALRNCGSQCTLLVKRRRLHTRCIYTIQFPVSNNMDHGLSLESGVYISHIAPGSQAAKEGSLAVGDRILTINNTSIDGIKNPNEVMRILNDVRYDMLTITTLKQILLSSTTSPAREYTPYIRDKSAYMHQRMVNSCSQTEDYKKHLGFEQPVVQPDRHYIVAQSDVYKASSTKSPDKGGHNSGPWEMIREKFDAVRGRKHSKDRQRNEKSKYRNSSPNALSNSYWQEQDAIAELDFVIESYRKNGKSGTSSTKSKSRSKAYSESSNMKNGGTWPKARSNVILDENPTGTIIQHPKRERPALSLFHENREDPIKISAEQQQQQPFCCQANNRNSNPIPINVQAPISNVLNRHSVYNSVDYPMSSGSSGIHYSKSGQLLCNQKSFTPTSGAFEKIDYDSDRLGAVSPQLDIMNEYKGTGPMVFSPIKSPNSMDIPKSQISKDIQDYYGTKKSKNIKYSSDNESLGPESLNPSLNSVSGIISSHSRIQSQIYSPITTTSSMHKSGHSLLPSLPYHMGHINKAQQHIARYPSPINVVQNSQSGESLGLSLSDRYSFEPPYGAANSTTIVGSCHTHGSSVDHHLTSSRSKTNHHHNRQSAALHGRDDHNNGALLAYPHGYEGGGTFPRKKENQRFRIPSNPSVTNSGGKVSTGSIERTSDHGSPMPTFHVEVLSPGNSSLSNGKHSSLPDYCCTQKPSPGELRRVHIDKSVEPLGIQIQCLDSGGVFVSTVTERSLASQVGLQIGDQLLEVCGINMRSATYQLAANVLRQCGNSITMLVQYSPDKYHELEGGIISSSSGGEGLSRSGSPTPRNSPRPNVKQISSSVQQGGDSSDGGGSRAQGQTLTRSQIAQAVTSLQRQSVIQTSRPPLQDQTVALPLQNHHQHSQQHQQPQQTVQQLQQQQTQQNNETRFLFIETRKCSNLGISLVGGNAVGIFVHSVQADSLAHGAGLRTGDQILEYNGSDLRRATAEQAAYELAKPADKVTVLAHYNMERYNEIKDKPGDSLYIRTGFDRLGDLGDSLQLRFSKDDVLYVDNTMFNGVPGHWRAWQLDSEGHRRQCGIIPSKYKVEEELMLRRSLGDIDNEARRGSTSARRSFFRRKKHQRSSSRDSKELASFSNITLGWYSDSGALNEECASYQRVERLDYPVFRPVLIIGPLADCAVDKLVGDFPDKFKRCIPEVMRYNQSAMEKGVQDNVFVDFKKKGVYYECTSVAAVKDICDKNTHCILDISVTSVERLHRQQIYPIVLLIRFKSGKQIKEVHDARYPMDKVSAKVAKEMYEHALKLETDFKHLISAVIPAGVSIAYICTQIKAAVDSEQSKTLWVAQNN